MLLRNKKTGKIVEFFNNTDGIFPDSLADLCKEWEDAPEKPKEFWHISCVGKINRVPYNEYCYYLEREIGNYFETKEEAELAVRKLRAWKRLKDKGVRVDGIEYFSDWATIEIKLPDNYWSEQRSEGIELLDLLFGGKE